MKALLKHRTKIVGLALLCVAFGSAALTLGRARGAVLIGQPLDVAVQVQLDAGEDVSALCFEADVFHADTRQDGNQVRLQIDADPQNHMAKVRILSSALVDEPVVTLYLRSGCGQKTTRRYVLLADLASEATAVSVPMLVPAAVPAAVKPVLTAPRLASAKPSSRASAGPLAAAASAPKAKTVAVLKAVAGRAADGQQPEVKVALSSARPAPSDAKTKAKAGRPLGQSRLKLDPLEVLSDRIANLDSFMSFAPSEDALLNIKKVQTLEADVKALRASALKSEASLADFKARLQKAEADRFPGVAIYGLVGLVLACLAAVAWLWSRQRGAAAGGPAWWSDATAPPDAQEPADRFTAAAPRKPAEQGLEARDSHGPVSSWFTSQPADASVSDALGGEAGKGLSSERMSAGAAGAENHPQPGLANATAHASLVRSLNSAAISEIRHQAEFFVTLGKTDQAATLLKKQIRESEEPNPFVYLDLLSLLHALGLKIEFQQYCQDFNLLFNGTVPEFAFFKDEGRDLESYPDVLARIAGQWPNVKVLELIEACIFRDPWAEQSQPFDLAALRDLLLLHEIARDMVLAPGSEGGEAAGGKRSTASSAAQSSESPSDEFDFVDSVAASFPALSESAMADLFAHEAAPPPMLDLDLADLERQSSSERPTHGTDIDLAQLLPSVHGAETDDAGTTEWPEPLPAPVPVRKKPAQEPLL